MGNTIEFFGEYKQVSVAIHVLSVVVGMGTALVSDILFNSFIKDKKIDKTEIHTLDILSTVVWISLLFIVLSGLTIFLSDPASYSESVKFLVKMTIVAGVIINGYVFRMMINPHLKDINFNDDDMDHKYVRLRKMSFAFGAISVVSWLSAFALGMLSDIPFSYKEAIMWYLILCFGGIVISQIIDKKIVKS